MQNLENDMELSLGFENVSIKQKKCIVRSRSEIDTTSEIIKGIFRPVPMIASCMDTVTNADFCNLLDHHGALGILHRAFVNDSHYVSECSKLLGEWRACAIGVSNHDFELSEMLVRAGANILVFDVAHGYSDHAIEFGRKLKNKFPHIKLVIGNTNNVGLLEETYDFADGVRLGVSNGAACQTSNTAGCREKQFSVVLKHKKLSREYGVPVISDGSIKEPADFTKAVGSGANSVIAGRIFAACPESAARVEIVNNQPKKVYSGMSSRQTQEHWLGKVKNDCPEGKTMYLDIGEPLPALLNRYMGALRSGISYAGGKDIKSFQNVVEFVRI